MFGTRRQRISPDLDEQLLKLLDRRVDIPALAALGVAVRGGRADLQLEKSAVCLDSSVFLRLANHRNSADIVDYFRSGHVSPLILPGQSIQEFWNNQLQAVATVTTKLGRKFEDLRKEFTELDENFGDYAVEVVKVLDSFSADHGHIYDEATVRKTGSLIDLLGDRAIVPYVSRQRFTAVAGDRKRTKTPPGFKDDGDGDFFIWADLLRGLQLAKQKGLIFEQVILVTEDKKVDWSRGAIPHPILSAEIERLVSVPFAIWKLDKLADGVTRVMNTED